MNLIQQIENEAVELFDTAKPQYPYTHPDAVAFVELMVEKYGETAEAIASSLFTPF